jgi:hypothetical protein
VTLGAMGEMDGGSLIKTIAEHSCQPLIHFRNIFMTHLELRSPVQLRATEFERIFRPEEYITRR